MELKAHLLALKVVLWDTQWSLDALLGDAIDVIIEFQHLVVTLRYLFTINTAAYTFMTALWIHHFHIIICGDPPESWST